MILMALSPETFSEVSLDRRGLILGTMFGCAAGVAWAREPTKHLDFLGAQKLKDIVPKSIGPWQYITASGLVLPPEDQLSSLLYSQMLTRVYSDGVNSPIMLLAAHSAGQIGILQIHRPEICYQAGGFVLSGFAPSPIAVGNRKILANRLDASAEGVDEHIIYWTRVGRDLPSSWAEQRLSTAKQNLMGMIPDAILVRVSTRSPDGKSSYEQLQSFVRALITAMSPAGRSVFIA